PNVAVVTPVYDEPWMNSVFAATSTVERSLWALTSWAWASAWTPVCAAWPEVARSQPGASTASASAAAAGHRVRVERSMVPSRFGLGSGAVEPAPLAGLALLGM